MKSLLLFLISCSFLFSGCGKKDKKPSPRSLYDHTAIAETLAKAAEEESRFAVFKQDPYFNLLWENDTFEEGERWHTIIDEQFAFLKEKFLSFRQIDEIGSPRKYAFGEDGFFSPSTLRLIALTGQLNEKIGSLDGADVVQIGADCGGWCKILNDVYRFRSYTIVDLPEPLALAKKCLEQMGVAHVRFLTPQELPKGEKFSLCISDKRFSEFDKEHQGIFFDRIIASSASGYLIAYEFPKHYGVAAMSLEQVKEKFRKKGKKINMDESSNYCLICWRGNSKT